MHEYIVTVEDNVVMGGAGSAVNELIFSENIIVRVCNLGLPDAFVAHGSREEILAGAGLSVDAIAKKVIKMMKVK